MIGQIFPFPLYKLLVFSVLFGLYGVAAFFLFWVLPLCLGLCGKTALLAVATQFFFSCAILLEFSISVCVLLIIQVAIHDGSQLCFCVESK